MSMLSYVYEAIDIVNEQIQDGTKIEKSPDTVLFGDDSALDSLTFVNLVVAIEDLVVAKTGISFTLVDEETFSAADAPFRTVSSLADLLEKKTRR
jgi:acyl carrier protein